MTLRLRLAAILLLTLCAAGSAFAATPSSMPAAPEPDPYPYTDRYKATVYGTPPEYRYALPKDAEQAEPETRSFKIDGRRVPELFWYCDAVEYSVLLQKREAPLVFIIAGTGGRFNSSKVRFLQQLFYSAGYHAVGVSSPTHYNSIVSLSKHGVSGYVPYDVEDLYTLMRWIKEDVEKTTKVSRYSVAGYSLGALHSAFLARRDAKDKVFNFDKVLLINPPVDLYHSALVFDSWLAGTTTDGHTPQQSVNRFMESFSDYYRTNQVGKLDSSVLYRFFSTLSVSDDELKQLIGIGFRITASSMIFTSDVCLKAGYVVPADHVVGTGEPLLPYFTAASNISFEQYVDEFLLPYVQTQEPGMTKERLLAACSLKGLDGFLRAAGNVYVVGNEDDPILSEDEVAYLKDAFGGRAAFFPRGGHCGNLQYTSFAQKLLAVMGQEAAK